MRRLTVLTVAYPFAPVGPDAAGGAEQIAARMDEVLVQRGHASIVVGCDGSQPAGTLVCVPRPDGALDDATRRAHFARVGDAVAWAVRRWPVDIVHCHGVDFTEYLPPAGVPVLATLHLPPSWYPASAFSPERPDTYFTCVSRSQLAACPPSPGLVPPVLNGIPVRWYVSGCARRRGALVLGRICPEKGVHLALDAARATDTDLIVAGSVFPYPEHLSYFENVVTPRLDARRRFVGAVGRDQKRRLLARARCLVVASSAPETSSLVSMEALASGTPVIAWTSGALPEIVDDGRTGRLVSDARALADALSSAELPPAEACRASAEDRFDDRRMTDAYLDLYHRLAGTHAVAVSGPRLDVSVARDAEAFAAMRPAWDTLYADCPEAAPFLSPDWITTWWQQFHPGEPCIVAVREAGRLIGVLPLYRAESTAGGTLRSMGIGIGDYADLLATHADGPRAARAALEALGALGHEWPTVELTDVPASSALGGAARAVWDRADIGPCAVCPVAPLPSSFEQFLAGLRGPRRRKLERAWRRLDALGTVRVQGAGPGTVGPLVDALIRLHTARWRARGLPGVLGDPAVQAFHRALAPKLLRLGEVRLWGLSVVDEVIGVVYAFQHGRRAYAYLDGFDPAFTELSVGSVLVAHAIRAAIADGCVAFDFLRGQESYKYAWGARDTQTISIRVGADDRAPGTAGPTR